MNIDFINEHSIRPPASRGDRRWGYRRASARRSGVAPPPPRDGRAVLSRRIRTVFRRVPGEPAQRRAQSPHDPSSRSGITSHREHLPPPVLVQCGGGRSASSIRFIALTGLARPSRCALARSRTREGLCTGRPMRVRPAACTPLVSPSTLHARPPDERALSCLASTRLHRSPSSRSPCPAARSR